jgi:peptidoglycan/LPS O-acetylase OafA/YrhL
VEPLANTYRVSGRRPELDGLRGVAVLLTILLHYVVRSNFYDNLGPMPVALFLNSLWSGVDIFFVLSGFLIGGIIIDHGSATNFAGVFYLRRALRILPVALLTIAAAYLFVPFLDPTNLHQTRVPAYSYLLFINNYWTASGFRGYRPLDPLWSLAIEEQFYLVAPAFFLLANFRIRNAVLALIVLLSPLLRAHAAKFSPWDFTPMRLDGFAAGMLVAILVRQPRFSNFQARAQRSVVLAVLGVLAIAVLFSVSPQLDQVRIAYGVTMNSLLAAGVILLLQMKPGSWLAKGLSQRWLTGTGRLSYFIYLMHVPILICTSAATGRRLGMWTPLLAFAICLASAWSSWRFLESRTIAIGKRVVYHGIEQGIAAQHP